MLLTAGGGFFSSSASGYRKGLALILLGQKNEDKLIRVAPWNRYQLVDQETNPDNQLASNKNLLVRASLVCFGCSTAGLESSLPLKVIPTQHQEVLPKVSLPDKEEKDQTYSLDLAGKENTLKKVTIKSCLGKPRNKILVSCGSKEYHETSLEKSDDSGWQTETRKVQWTDTHGGELVEIREFEARKSTCLPMLCLPLRQT